MRKNLICFIVFLIFVVAISGFSYDLVIDLASRYRTVTHLASGSLYGLYDDQTPSDSLVVATSPFMFTQPAANGEHEPYDYGRPVGDILDTAAKAARAGATVTMRMADTFPTWPYNFTSVADWTNRVNQMITDWLASGHTNLYAYEIYNEPNYTYNGGSIISFNDLWKLTYDIIRSRHPGAKIMGPSITHYDDSWMRDFLTYCKNNNCYPDIVSWHELQGAWVVQGSIDTYKQLEQDLGMYRPVSINEYVASGEDGQPGKITDYISGFERNLEVESACLPFWSTCGSMGNILTSNFQPNGAYWVFKWYGDMNGSMVWAEEPASMIDGFASINSSRDKVYIIFGGADNQRIVINGFSNTSLGNRVHVYAEYTEWVGVDTVYNSPGFWFEGDYDVVNDQLILDVNNLNEYSAHRITITPADGNSSGDLQTGVYYSIVSRNSGKALDVYNWSTENGGNIVQWDNWGGACQRFRLESTGDGYYYIINQNSGKAIDIEGISTSNGANVFQWEYLGGANQQFSILPTGDGYYYILVRHSGKAIDVEGVSTENGANVIQWDYLGGANQQWSFIQ